MEFKFGDVVKLKSGGPEMTVAGASADGELKCTWFNKEGVAYTVETAFFIPDALKKA